MWKISYLLLLTIIFDNCLTLEPTRLKTTVAPTINRNYDNQNYQLDVDEANYEDDYNSPEVSEEFQGGRLIGRWRNNGKAIEPKWRDGDSIPLVPFEEAATLRRVTPKPKEKSPSNGHDIINHALSTNKYREIQDEDDNNNKKNDMNTRASDIESIPDFVSSSKEIRNYGRVELHESSRHNDYTNIPRNGSRRYRTRKQKPVDLQAEKTLPATNYERKTLQQTPLHDNNPKISGNIDDIKVRFDANNYQNPLQIHVNDYEFNDEEYHRPRSRKRRPPQNYEYVEIKTPYPSLDFWQKTLESSTTDRINHQTLNNTPSNSRKNLENSELKSLLKMQQIEGSSLSEILQRRNLTLGDLLRGKIEIINALKSNNEQDTDHVTLSAKKIARIESIMKPSTSSERPKWVTNRRVRIKELRRNQIQTTTSTYGNIFKKISDNNINNNNTYRINDTRVMSTVDTERKSHDNVKLSTAINQTKSIIFPRLNSTRMKPPIITRTTTTIKSNIKDFTIQHDVEKHLTTTLSTIDDEEIMEFSDFSEKRHREDSSISSPINVITKSELTTISNEGLMAMAKYNDVDKDLGSTLSIEHILLTEPTTSSTLTTANVDSIDANKSNTLIDYNNMKNNADFFDTDEMEYQNDGPKNDEESMSQTTMQFPKIIKIQKENRVSTVGHSDDILSSKNHWPLSSNNTIYDQVISEIEPEARAEIFELISSGSSAQRLEELLKSRNMSINELISLRQRGSSRVHLADISRLQSRSHKQKIRGDQLFVPMQIQKINNSKSIPITTPSNLDVNKNSSQLETYSTLDKINGQTYKKINETKRHYIVVDKTPIIIEIPSRSGKQNKSDYITMQKNSEELVDLLSAFDSLPFAIYNNYPVTSTVESTTVLKIGETTESSSANFNLEDVAIEPETTTDIPEVGLVEEIAYEAGVSNDELSTTTDENYTFIPKNEDDRKILSKVRPSIIASGAILGMTIVGFLAIFIVCRIRQKQKYMYKNTFSKAVFQAPAMNARKLSNSSSLNTMMVNVVTTSTTKRSMKHETQEIGNNFDVKSDIDNDSLDANDSWDTIPDFMK